MRVVVTGAAGMIGANLLRGLNAIGIDDIIAVDDDPTQNVRLLEQVGFVMKSGRVHKLAGQRQLTSAD